MRYLQVPVATLHVMCCLLYKSSPACFLDANYSRALSKTLMANIWSLSASRSDSSCLCLLPSLHFFGPFHSQNLSRIVDRVQCTPKGFTSFDVWRSSTNGIAAILLSIAWSIDDACILGPVAVSIHRLLLFASNSTASNACESPEMLSENFALAACSPPEKFGFSCVSSRDTMWAGGFAMACAEIRTEHRDNCNPRLARNISKHRAYKCRQRLLPASSTAPYALNTPSRVLCVSCIFATNWSKQVSRRASVFCSDLAEVVAPRYCRPSIG